MHPGIGLQSRYEPKNTPVKWGAKVNGFTKGG